MSRFLRDVELRKHQDNKRQIRDVSNNCRLAWWGIMSNFIMGNFMGNNHWISFTLSTGVFTSYPHISYPHKTIPRVCQTLTTNAMQHSNHVALYKYTNIYAMKYTTHKMLQLPWSKGTTSSSSKALPAILACWETVNTSNVNASWTIVNNLNEREGSIRCCQCLVTIDTWYSVKKI